MTAQDFLEKLQRTKLRIATDDTPLKLGSYSVIALQSIRIFTDGRDSNGNAIGKYSTDPIYINPKGNKTFIPRNKGGLSPPTGKTGKTIFESTGKPHKTSYFEGWKGFREAQGLPTGNVDLNYSGELFSDFCNPQNNVPTTRKVSNTEYVTALKRPLSILKLAGNEERFKTTIGNLTSSERARFYETVGFEVRKILASV